MRINSRLGRRGVLGVALAAALAGCAGDLPVVPDTPIEPYRLGTGDTVRIITFGEAQLTGEFRVNDAGNLAVPLLGTMPASGRSTDELQAAIAGELERRKLIVDPSVSVEVTAYRPIFVLGEVGKPGQYAYQPGMTVLSAVAVAGGFTYSAQQQQAVIQRQVAGRAVEGTAERGTRVHPGDIITVRERYF